MITQSRIKYLLPKETKLILKEIVKYSYYMRIDIVLIIYA